MLFYIVFFLTILLFVLFAFFYFLFFLSALGRHDLPTTKKAVKVICKIISHRGLERGNFYDLGCGRGELVIAIKKKFPHLNIVAVEKSALRLLIAKLRAKCFGGKIDFRRENLFKTNLQNADVVYTYLWYNLMPPLFKKLQKELKKGAIVITNTSNFPEWKPQKTYITRPLKPDFEKLFVYVKK